jgi:membrane associated rhomboid family serine protease
MKLFTLSLLAINIVTFAWVIFGARMNIPPWEKAFYDTRSAINNLPQDVSMMRLHQDVLHNRVNTAESWSRITIDEYRRSDAPLVILTIINILGLTFISLKNQTRKQQAGDGNSVERV